MPTDPKSCGMLDLFIFMIFFLHKQSCLVRCFKFKIKIKHEHKFSQIRSLSKTWFNENVTIFSDAWATIFSSCIAEDGNIVVETRLL